MSKNFGFMSQFDGNGRVNELSFVVRQILRNKCSTAMIVKVLAANATARTVDIQCMVDQVTPEGVAIPHSTIHEVPYGYDQGGNCLIQVDPVAGDIGVAVFAHRDITRVKRTQKAAAPQTLRAHHLSDALYIRTLWAAQAPAHTIKLDPQNGITITSGLPVTVNANVQVNGSITATGDVKGGGISLENHVHTGVQTGGGSTGKPQ